MKHGPQMSKNTPTIGSNLNIMGAGVGTKPRGRINSHPGIAGAEFSHPRATAKTAGIGSRS